MVITTQYDLLLGGLAAAVLTVVFLRSGLVVLMSAVFVAVVLARYPITLDVSTWYAGTSLFALLTIAGLAVYGLWVSLAGRPLFKDELAEA